MAVQTVQTTGDIPAALEPFYIGRGTPGTADYQPGLIELGTQAIFPDKLSGIDAYKRTYAPLIEAGLTGAGAVAPMSAGQEALGQRIAGLALPGQFQTATEAGQLAATGLQSLQDLQAMGVTAPELSQFQMTAPERVAGGTYQGPQMTAAQTGFRPDLQQFQMQAPEQFGAAQAQQYMSPYMQQVVEIQQRRAIENAQRAQLGQNLAAARQGTYGGARQALLQSQRESGLRQQLGDIQATGLQSAFQQAQEQFERDRAAGMTAQQRNLEAALGVQQLGTQTGLQAALANLSNEQQAAVQNQAAALQAQGLTAQQAMQAALANQQAGLTTAQQNLGAALGIQQLGAGQSLEAQRANQQAALQAAQQRLAASQGLTQLGQTMGGLGTQQLAGELDITKTLGAYGDLQRAIQQQQIDARRQDLLQQAQYGQTQVGQLSNLLRGIPMTDTTQTVTTPPPSFASQLTGLGLTGIGLYNLLGGGQP